ncbi:MAG: hypothetical protein AABZ31_13940 [Bdellovibrionota bacterium]
MSLSIKPFVLAILSVIATQTSFAYEYCREENTRRSYLQEAGFFLTSQRVQILKSKRFLERNKTVTAAKAEERILESIQKARKPIETIEDKRLAKLLATASFVVGVDFQQLSSMVKKETHYCLDRSNNSGSGASGCTQFTTIALKELKDQFGYKGTGKHTKSEEAEKVLRGFVTQYFSKMPDPTREKSFYAWLNSSVANMQTSLRGRGNFDIDILSGAILLKIFLSTNGGNYYKALVQYNGDNSRQKLKNGKRGPQYKFKYAGDVQNMAQYISMDEANCIQAVVDTEDMIEDSCESFGEDPYTCVGSEPSLQPPPEPVHMT